MKSEMLSWLKEHIAQTHISELKKEWLEIEKLNLDDPRAFEYINLMQYIYEPFYFRKIPKIGKNPNI